MFTEIFLDAAEFTANLLAVLLGAAFSLAVFSLIALLVGCLLGAVFDTITQQVAARWTRKGIKPNGRIAQVILSHGVRDG